MDDNIIINIQLENPANENYQLWDEYSDDIVIETETKPNKFFLFFNKIGRFFRNLFCKCLIKTM
jgi:hypothetical protein